MTYISQSSDFYLKHLCIKYNIDLLARHDSGEQRCPATALIECRLLVTTVCWDLVLYSLSCCFQWFLIVSIEPSHEIMVLFILRKLILQMRIGSLPVGQDVGFLVGPFVYFHTLCVRTGKALARLCGCADSPEPSLVAYVINTIISWAGSVLQLLQFTPYLCNINKIGPKLLWK